MMRSKARTFYLASLFLPGKVRRDVQIVYAYYRMVDDLVDEPAPNADRTQIFRQLEEWDKVLVTGAVSVHPLLVELNRIVNQYRVDPVHLRMILQGARFDLDMVRIQTLEDLKHYAVLVAGSVGMVMAPMLGDHEGFGRGAACDLGVAMQLTNVLRDIREDAVRGRIYLPAQELRTAGVSEDSLRAGILTEPFKGVVRQMVQETRRLYQSGIAGLVHLDPSSQLATYLAATLYERILDKIEQRDFDVFSGRPHLGQIEKWRTAIPVYLEHRLLKGML